MTMHKNMAESNKHNLMVAAFECGSRLERRDENVLTAFTYGQKIKYKDLDDPNYKEQLIFKNKCKVRPSINFIENKKLEQAKNSLNYNK